MPALVSDSAPRRGAGPAAVPRAPPAAALEAEFGLRQDSRAGTAGTACGGHARQDAVSGRVGGELRLDAGSEGVKESRRLPTFSERARYTAVQRSARSRHLARPIVPSVNFTLTVAGAWLPPRATESHAHGARQDAFVRAAGTRVMGARCHSLHPARDSLHLAEIFPREFARGFGEGLKRYGLLLENLDYRFMDGVAVFLSTRGRRAARGDGSPAPGGCLGPAGRVASGDPGPARDERRGSRRKSAGGRDLELRDREGQARRRSVSSWRSRPSIRPGDGERRPSRPSRPAAARMRNSKVYRHHRFQRAGAASPSGDFLAHAQDWTGRPARELLGLLRGTSKVSLGCR